jgi:predicted RNA methylase
MRNWLLVFILAVAAASSAFAQTPQNGKYGNRMAPYVPSPQTAVERMLEMAHLKAGETLFDLGSGDGRVLITAVQRYQVKAVGIEISDKLVASTNRRIEQLGLQSNAKVLQGDLFECDLSGADTVVVYLITHANEKLRPRLEKYLKPGSRVVSFDYAIPGWKPTKVDLSDPRGHRIYLYEMPPQKN